MIPVGVSQVFLSNLGFVVLLKGTTDERTLPIFVGAAEAQAIAIQINELVMPRPLTHDLLKNILDLQECRLMKVEVCDLKKGTFFARLVLDRDGQASEVDARPSDAIALALRTGAPIFVAEPVMDEAGRVMEPPESTEETEEQELSDQPIPVPDTPEEQLTKELEKAVADERYEDAARLRDEIKKLKNSHSEN